MTYKYNKPNSCLVQQPGMEKPICILGIYPCTVAGNKRCECEEYNSHLASLLTLPLLSIPEGWVDGKVVVEGKDFTTKEQVLLSYGQGSTWYNIDSPDINGIPDDAKRRILAIPIQILSVSDTPKQMVKSNPNYHLQTPTDLQGFARMCWSLIYGSLRDAQEQPLPHPDMDYLIEVYRIAYKIMTGEDSKYIPILPAQEVITDIKAGAIDKIPDYLERALDHWKIAHKEFDSGYRNVDGKTTRINIAVLSTACNQADTSLRKAINQYKAHVLPKTNYISI